MCGNESVRCLTMLTPSETCMEELNAVARKLTSDVQKRCCLTMAKMVDYAHVPPSAPIVQDLINGRWSRVELFYERVWAKKTVTEFAVVKANFADEAHKLVNLYGPPRAVAANPVSVGTAKQSPSRPDSLQIVKGAGSLDYLQIVKGAGMLLGFVCLLCMSVWAVNVLSVTFGSSRKEEPTCLARLEQMETFIKNQEEVNQDVRNRLVLAETGSAAVEAFRKQQFQDSLRENREQTTRALMQINQTAEAVLKNVKTSTNVLEDRIGSLKMGIETATFVTKQVTDTVKDLEAKTDRNVKKQTAEIDRNVKEQTAEIEKIQSQVKPLSDSLADTTMQANALRVQVKDMAGAFDKASWQSRITLAGCVATVCFVVFWSYHWVRPVDDQFQPLQPSHGMIGMRVNNLEKRVSSLERVCHYQHGCVDAPAQGPRA